MIMQEMLAPFPDEKSTRDIELIAETRGKCECKVREMIRTGTLAPDSWKLDRFSGNRLISKPSPHLHGRRGRRGVKIGSVKLGAWEEFGGRGGGKGKHGCMGRSMEALPPHTHTHYTHSPVCADRMGHTWRMSRDVGCISKRGGTRLSSTCKCSCSTTAQEGAGRTSLEIERKALHQ